jgi:hypothetical protein
LTALWHIKIEVCVQPEDFPEGHTQGFMNVITWAVSPGEACGKLSRYVQTFDWHVIEVQSVSLVQDRVDCSPELEDMIDRAQDNPLAVILGTFHSFELN